MDKLKNGWHHFCTITKHKWIVMRQCFRVGLYRQGIMHDLSKYSPEEFRTGALYFQGNRSPMRQKKKKRAIPGRGCIIREEISTIMNIGLIYRWIKQKDFGE